MTAIFSFYAFLAFAQVAKEDTIGIEDQSASYFSHAYIDATQYVPDPPKPLNGLFKPTPDGYCVSFVQAHGFSTYRGDAHTWKRYIIEGAIGWPGDAVLLDEGPLDHLALIVGTDDGYNLVEQNYEGLGIVSTRSVPFNYSKIIGFIPKPVKNDTLQ